MPLFICRWQNGDFSAVSAATRDEAVDLLDQVGNADAAELFAFKNFMVHFQLKRETDDVENPVPVELEGFGEETLEMICERVYPVYNKTLGTVDEDWPTDSEVPQEKLDAALKVLNEALVTERMRNWASEKPTLSNDADVAELQKVGDVPKSVAERAVKERRRRAVVEMPSESDKVQ